MNLWLIDNSLRGKSGHPLEYATVVAAECGRRGICTRAIAQQSAPALVSTEYSIEPVFRHSLYERFNADGLYLKLGRLGIAADYWKANREFRQDLASALKGRLSPEDIVFAPSADHRQLFGWAGWLKSLPARLLPKSVVLMLRYNLRDGVDLRLNPNRKLMIHGLAAIKKLVDSGYRIRMATDSERLAEEYADYTDLKFEIFPIPHTEKVSTIKGVRPSGDPVRIVALGDARPEKGYDILADSIRALELLAVHKTAGLAFHIQCPILQKENVAGRRQIDELRKLNMPNLTLIEEVLSSEDYAALLAGADAVALPYRKQQYFARTSGPLTEALAAAKPVIVTDDTWLSDQLVSHGAGYAIRDGDVVGLAQALQWTRDNIASLTELSRDRQPGWVAFHNPRTFVDMLIGG